MTYPSNGGPLSEGWIARHRSVRDHWLVGHGIHVKPADPERKRCHTQGEAWEDLLMECRYADGTVSNGGKKMELKRGEVLGAVSWLASRWNWTPKTVRRFLDQLENDGMIELKNPASEKGSQIGRQANVVTVCNYEEYQSGYAREGQLKGQPEGGQRATRGRPEGNIYKDNKGTREQEEGPPTPETKPDEGFQLEGDPVAKGKVASADIDGAFEDWNKAAAHLGLVQCRAITDQRKKRMAKRLADIGGREQFRLALNQIRLNDFLMGRTRPREGDGPFKLDIDRLLSSGSGMGDVLAGLIDVANAQGAGRVTAWWQDPQQANDVARWRDAIAKHANGVWPVEQLGPPPGSRSCVVPRSLISELRLEEKYTTAGFARGGH